VARPRAECEREIREIIRWRKEHQPGGTFNAGSVFKNPPGDAAGRIIDSMGLKGLRVGGAAVSDRHANFFVAAPGTSAQDVHDLVAEVRKRVREATGIDLEPELRFVGEFGEDG
jgi:UDP-N-acetylmuramate dehydrogenase